LQVAVAVVCRMVALVVQEEVVVDKVLVLVQE